MNDIPTTDPTADPALADPGEVEELLPVTVLTGFLGSGKTTLLNRLLDRPELQRTAVVINEFGEIGLDHQLVRRVDETTVLLNSGCLCCTVRDDLVSTLRELFWKRRNGQVPRFERLVVETTGLADPAPIIHTLMRDAMLASCYRLDGVVVTVDAATAEGTLDRQMESVKQAAMADRLVVTKSDLVPAAALTALETRLRRLNPAAPILRAQWGEIDPAALFNAGLYDPESKSLEVRRWLKAEAFEEEPAGHSHSHDHGHDHGHHHGHDHDHGALDRNRHDAHIRAFCITYGQPLAWDRFADWVEMLIMAHGERLLRIKGILNVAGESAPVVVHGVQHLFHPPVQMAAWPDDDRRSRLVFIVRDIDKTFFERTLASFNEGAAPIAPMNEETSQR